MPLAPTAFMGPTHGAALGPPTLSPAKTCRGPPGLWQREHTLHEQHHAPNVRKCGGPPTGYSG